MSDRLPDGLKRLVPSPDRNLPSLLPPWLRGLLVAVLALGAFMLANTAYLLLNRLADAVEWELLVSGATALPAVFQAMVLTHTGVGLVLAVLVVVFVVAHLTKVWDRRHRTSVVSGIVLATAAITLAVTGLFILTAAASRENRWAWWLHVACAAIVVVGYVAHRLFSYSRPRGDAGRRFGIAVAGLLAVLVGVHVLTDRTDAVPGEEPARAGATAYDDTAAGTSEDDPAAVPGAEVAASRADDELVRSITGAGGRERRVARWSDSAFVPAGWVPPESPFFPSAATTTSGGYLPARIITRGELATSRDSVRREVEAYGFVKDARLGAETCARCHQAIVEQWSTSVHRFASFNNPFYEATIDDMRENAVEPNRWIEEHASHFPDEIEGFGRVKSKWCSGCHDPAIMLAGNMGLEVDRASTEAQAGLTCLACHAVDRIHDVTGNGNYNVADEQEDPYLFADAEAGTLGAFLHDAALKAKPTVHRRQMRKEFFGTSEFCATCHKVSLREPLNNYRWLRGQDEYDNWHDSGVPRNASRTFYLPDVARGCQDCHMPRVAAPEGDVAAEGGTVRSHRFLAVNTALPHVRGDTATIRRIERFLQDGKLRVDVFALRRSGRPAIMDLENADVTLRPGERVTVDVVVRNQGVGHTFPGGTNDSNEGWIEFTLRDSDGRTLLISGALGDDGHLDPMAHPYKALILDEDGDPIHRRNAQDIHVTVYANVIGPGTADVARYEFTVPPELAGRELEARARLLWRKFDRNYTEFAYETNPEGFTLFDEVPDLPVTEIERDAVRLPVAGGSGGAGGGGASEEAGSGTREGAASGDDGTAEDADTPLWIRYNDYGIALLLQDDTRGATRAFERVAELEPGRIDGPLNLARAAIRDGNLDRAFEHLGTVEEIETGDSRAAWVWGRALQEDGRYELAALAYRRVLEAFPEDRAAWRNLGRTLYLDGRYEAALDAFDRVLEIDPEDRVAHYHRMLSFRSLGRSEEADVAEMAYRHYQVDESAQQITRAYRLEHPGANLETQALHTHEPDPPARARVERNAAGSEQR